MEKIGLPDTPWHVGYVKKEENDSRRHKSRCVHISCGICTYGKLRSYMKNCPGSAHCKYYAENEQQREEVYLRTRTIEEEKRDEFLNKYVVEEKKDDNECDLYKVEKPHVFTGIKTIRVNEICLSREYHEWEPNQEEVEKLLVYYEKYKKMDKPIVVEVVKQKYYIKDNFLQYYVSKKLKKTWIRSTMNLKIPGKKRKKRN